MFRYGRFCPVAKALEVLGERWTLLVVRELLSGSTPFSQLERGLPKVFPTTLSKRLAELQDAGVRIDDGEVEVCLHDPGDEVDVYFPSTLRTLTAVWMGDVPLVEARRQGALKIVGRDAWLRNLSAWFALHVLAATPRSPRELSC